MKDQTFEDLQAIASELIEAFGLKYEGRDPGLANPLMRWLDFRLRYVERRPRKIAKSEGFDQRVPQAAKGALRQFENLVRTGADLNPYMSRRTKKTDTSGEKRQWRTDGLWADWDIHHAHLTLESIAEGSELSASSDWLLYFIEADDWLAFIDVRSHAEPGGFQAIDLIEKAFTSWPAFAKQFEMKGIVGLSSSPDQSPEGIASMRKGGVAQIIEIGRKVYVPPGLGMTTASTALRTSLLYGNVLRAAEQLMAQTRDPGSWIWQAAAEKGLEGEPFKLVIFEGMLARAAGHIAWTLERDPPANSAQAVVEYALLPEWAASRLEAWRQTKQQTGQEPGSAADQR